MIKGCFFVIVSRKMHLQFYEASILQNISDYKKILIADSSMKNDISDVDRDCYDEIVFTNALKVTNIALIHDLVQLEEAIKSFIKNIAPENVYVFSSDEYNIEVVAEVTAKLGLRGYRPNKVNLFRDKHKMKAYLRENSDVDIPNDILLDDIAHCNYHTLTKELGSPFVLKPTDQAGGLGVSIIKSEHEWEVVRQRQENSFFNYEAETFLTGALFHIDSVRINKKIVAVAVCEYLFPIAEYVDGKLLGSILLTEKHPAYGDLEKFNQKVIDAFDEDGSFHLECFWKPGSKPAFVEIAWRQAGKPSADNFTQAYQGYTQSLVNVFASLGYTIPNFDSTCLSYVDFLLPKKKGIFQGIKPLGLQGEAEITFLLEKDQPMEDAIHIFDDSAHVRLHGKSYALLYQDFLTLRKLKNIYV